MGYENRQDIPVKYTWDLSAIYPNETLLEKDCAAAGELIGKIKNYEGKLNNEKSIYEFFELTGDIEELFEKAICYTHMKMDEDSKNTDVQAMRDKVLSNYNKYSVATSFVQPELSRLDEKTLDEIMAKPQFKKHNYTLRRIKAGKAHVLSAEAEELLTNAGEVTGYFRETFGRLDNGEMDWGTVKVDGEPVALSHGSYSMLMQNPSQEVRKQAFEAWYKAYEGKINTIAGLYCGSVRQDCFFAKARKFGSAIEKALFYEEVDRKVYDNLIDSVNKTLPMLHEYMALRKKVMGLETLNMYDLNYPMIPAANLALEFDEAFALVKEGLKPLGEEYQGLLQRAYDERWMDVYETPGKRSGAYSMGVYGVHPYVLLNYEKTTHDVFIIAHELGHSMHSYYSCQAQGREQNNYTIFVAEVASTCNEILLLRHLLKKETDKDMRKYLLSYLLDTIRTTMFRQTMFAEFEAKAHELIETDKPFNYESLSDIYYGLNKKYYGPAVEHNRQIRYEWCRIPHFYRGFYVYKYATGITSAICIADKILKEGEPAVKRYKEFLSTGCSLDPVNELRIAGVDLETSAPFETVAKIFKETLDELKELCK